MSIAATWSEWVDHPGLVSFYTSHRHRPEDLYPSERRFLPWLAHRARSVLDVGCASGGFAEIWRHFNPELEYRGVDVSKPLIDAARRAHPELEFVLADCAAGVPLASASSDVVQALGWLHWEPRYLNALAELWRLTSRWLFFDVRLVEADVDLTGGEQRLTFTGVDDGVSATPYICVSWATFARAIRELGPDQVLAYGYWGRPAESVTGVDREVCFATFVLERGDASRGADPRGMIDVALELPLSWPPGWSTGVRDLGDGWLARRIPAAHSEPAR